MTVGILLSFMLIVAAVLVVVFTAMGTGIDGAALASARAGALYVFPQQASQAITTAQAVFVQAIPHSTQVDCSAPSVTPPAASGGTFSVSSDCTINLGVFLGQRVSTTWTAAASVPTAPYGSPS